VEEFDDEVLTEEQLKSAKDKFNRIVFTSGDNPEKTAALANAAFYVKRKRRDRSVADRINDPIPVKAGDSTLQVTSEDLVYIGALEPLGSPAVVTGFGAFPDAVEFLADRFAVPLFKVQTNKYYKNTYLLANSPIDLHQIITDISIKDLSIPIDEVYLGMVDSAVMSVDTPNAVTGLVQHKSISGYGKTSIAEAAMIIAQGPFGLDAKKAAAHFSTSRLMAQAQSMDSVGPEKVSESASTGIIDAKYLGTEFVFSVRKHLFSDNTIYWFSDNEYIGIQIEYDGPTMYVDKRADYLEFFTWMVRGAAFPNTNGVAKTRHSDS
jgi:hypothetical protein